MEKLVLIDGNSLINRAFYAMPVLTTKDGVPTNAVYGFLNMLFKILTDEKPTYMAVAFDLKAPTFRHKMYDGYKATRKPMPEELRPQIPLLKDLLRLMNITVVEKEGVEADDIIGTIAKHTSILTQIYTGDKDSFQLVDEETSVYFTKRGITDIDVYSIDNFKDKTGIEPIQIIDLKALMGDSSDNIPGVPGVGEKTAKTLIEEYGTIEKLYLDTSALKGKLKEKIDQGKDFAYLSKTLATINVDCGVDTDVSKMVVKFPFSTAFKNKLLELELKTIARRDEFFTKEDAEVLTNEVKKDRKEVVVKNLSKKTFENLDQNKIYAVYVSDQKISIFDGECEYQEKIRQTLLDDGVNYSEAIELIEKLLYSNAKIIVYDIKALKKRLISIGKNINFNADDLALVKYLVDFSGKAESFEEVMESYGKNKNLPAYALFEIYQELYAKLLEYGLKSLYEEIELPLSNVLLSMENAGFKVDINALTEAGKKYRGILDDLESEIREMTGESSLNVNSPKQLGEVLFEKLKIGKGKKTKSGYSTSAEVLEGFEDTAPVVSRILAYRKIQKLHSTYVEGFKPLIDKTTGLIHTTFNQTVTATGRLSSSEPNLQNIPVRESEGKELRKFFVPKDKDRILITADYSQIELRLLADFSKTQSLIQAFNNGEDVHSRTAERIFKVSREQVTSDMRRKAKAVNFGIIYGISEYGLAKNIKITPFEAREYINSYFNEFKEVKKYMQDNVDFAKSNGYSITYFNRRRYIRELNAQSYTIRQFGERVAMNMPLQGSAADIIKVAMINVYNRLKKEGLKSELILQVHDELIIDAFINEKEVVQKLLKEEMENAVKLSVPLTAEVGTGKTWFEAK